MTTVYGKVIRVDSQVFMALQDKAYSLGKPFTSPNNILRIVLGLKELDKPRDKGIK